MENMIRNALIGLIVAVAAAGCSKDSGTSPTSTVNVPFSNTDLRVGTGTEAQIGRTVSVNYTGWLYSTAGTDNKGTQFDTSVGKTPLVFQVGTSGIISGFNQGVNGMKVGGLRRTVMPPSLAYGSQGSGSAIPPNATLVFEIELLAVQ